MSKVRLKEVVSVMKDIKDLHKKMDHRQADVAKAYLVDNFGEWLIEQAERVQELEDELNKQLEIGYKFEGKAYDLAKQNKRYREAFNKSREIWDKAYENYKGNKVEYLDEMLDGAKFIIDIFEKALEESK